MGLENYISESEAASQAGVSTRTLQRFAEAGYLKVEIEPDGLRLYSRQQIHEIFGMSASLALGQTSMEELPAAMGQSVTEAEQLPPQEIGTETPDLAPSPNLEHQPQIATGPQEAPTPRTSEGANQAPIVIELEREVARLRNLVKAQESLLDAKESEIREHRSQRDWLRARVERLEEKSDRDQLLLLSETQTIRKLITLQEQRKSSMRQFFEWLGLTPTLPASNQNSSSELVRLQSSKPIDMKKAANE